MKPVAVAVGTFDGVHLGHRHLLEAAARLAAEASLELVVVTFHPHPRSLLCPARAPRLLTGLDHKLELLAGVPGVSRVEVLRFDRSRAEQTPESFLTETLAGELAARLVVVGANFRFGRGGAGDLALAARLGAHLGVRAVGVRLAQGPTGVVISSSEIRRLISLGQLGSAGALLGRPFELRGDLRPLPPTGATAHCRGASSMLGQLHVAPEVLTPPPGRYRVWVGPLEGAGAAAFAWVKPAGEAIALEASTTACSSASWRSSRVVRIAFEANVLLHEAPWAARAGSTRDADR